MPDPKIDPQARIGSLRAVGGSNHVFFAPVNPEVILQDHRLRFLRSIREVRGHSQKSIARTQLIEYDSLRAILGGFGFQCDRGGLR